MPAAEVMVDVPLVRSLLHEQHPDLATLPLERISNGWDNAIFRLGEGPGGSSYTVRLPRRRVAVQLLLNEQRWLPVYAAATSVPVPAPLRLGRPSALFPWPWSVNPWFDGVPALGRDPARCAGLAVPLARFLADIHRPAPGDAPRNPVRGLPLASRDQAFRARLESGAVPQPRRLLSLWEELVAVPHWSGPPLWLHGDLHPGNILQYDGILLHDRVPQRDGIRQRDGGLAAVIDFGDLTSGDPATDLATAWMTFDADGRRAFRAELDRLTGTDADTWQRARGWALNIAGAMLLHSDDSPPLFELGRHTVAQLLAEA